MLVRRGRAVDCTGCAEKKMSFCERMAPQTMAASYQKSATATPVVWIAVSRPNIQSICLPVQQLQCLHHVSCTSPTEGWGRLPIQRFWYKGCPSGWLASPLCPRSGSSSLCPRAAAALAGTPVADAIANSWKCLVCCGGVLKPAGSFRGQRDSAQCTYVHERGRSGLSCCRDDIP